MNEDFDESENERLLSQLKIYIYIDYEKVYQFIKFSNRCIKKCIKKDKLRNYS